MRERSELSLDPGRHVPLRSETLGESKAGDEYVMLRSVRVLAAALVCSLALLSADWVGAVPKPPPKFWGASRCEQVLVGVYGYASQVVPAGYGLPTGDGHGFHPSQAICVGSGGPHACRWTSGHRVRLYSQFTVFARSPGNGGVVRSLTLATRAGRDFVPVAHHAGDQYAGWPPDFYMSRVELLATEVTPARFRSIVAPHAARVARQENATRCTGAS